MRLKKERKIQSGIEFSHSTANQRFLVRIEIIVFKPHTESYDRKAWFRKKLQFHANNRNNSTRYYQIEAKPTKYSNKEKRREILEKWENITEVRC